MANVELPRAIDERVTDSAGSTGSKPTPARVRHTFTVPPGDYQAAIDDAAAAEEAGWALSSRATGGFDGAKDIDGYGAVLLIDGIETEDRVWVEVSTQDV